MSAIISAKNVFFSYDKKIKIINGISLEINRGEYVALVGSNGSGKSTLSKLFNGLLIPESGEIIVDGISSKDKKRLFDIRKKVGVVFQNPDNQIVASIIEDDIAFGPENVGLKRDEIEKRIDYALKAVGMENFRRGSPDRLSGGQKQRVAIAGILALKPEVLILDESTSMLDPQGRKEVLEVVKKLNESGTTVIVVTHYMEEVIKADRVYVLDGGKVALTGTPKEIFSNPDIEKYGLELPIPVKIARDLAKEGIDLPQGILDKKELVNVLCK